VLQALADNRVVLDAAGQPRAELGKGAAGVGEQQLQAGVPVVNAGEDQARDGDRCLKREACRELQDVAVLDLATVVGLLCADAIVRVP
jgi:hypothetical protein